VRDEARRGDARLELFKDANSAVDSLLLLRRPSRLELSYVEMGTRRIPIRGQPAEPRPEPAQLTVSSHPLSIQLDDGD
jgi:hypothetical protein